MDGIIRALRRQRIGRGYRIPCVGYARRAYGLSLEREAVAETSNASREDVQRLARSSPASAGTAAARLFA